MKENEKRERGKKKRRERKQRESKRRNQIEREKRKRGIFLVFQRSNPDGPRVKVNPHIAGYAWVLISWSFVKLRKVVNFPTWNIFSLKFM